MNYIQLTFTANLELTEIIAANLMEEGFEGIEDIDGFTKTYIKEDEYNDIAVKVIFDKYNLQFHTLILQDRNWNAEWEANFQPVQVGDFVSIRASFHPALPATRHDIIINPKMSFGTGHHATTWLMMRQMQEINFNEKAVIDFGTGTGILAILAEKLGASSIIAIDNDDNCIDNAKENIDINNCSKIRLLKDEMVSGDAEIILANINKNIILANLKIIAETSTKGGLVLFSGLLKEDYYDILDGMSVYNLHQIKYQEKDNWISILCQTL
ncbi:MAG: 50S ribosomal protein L11 methyltransferase [Ferruginibacter sp.]